MVPIELLKELRSLVEDGEVDLALIKAYDEGTKAGKFDLAKYLNNLSKDLGFTK